VLIAFAALTLLASPAHAQSQTFNLQSGILNFTVSGTAYPDCTYLPQTRSNPATFDSTGKITFAYSETCANENAQVSGTVTLNVPTSFTGTPSSGSVISGVSTSQKISGTVSETDTNPSAIHPGVLFQVTSACVSSQNQTTSSDGSAIVTATISPCALPTGLSGLSTLTQLTFEMTVGNMAVSFYVNYSTAPSGTPLSYVGVTTFATFVQCGGAPNQGNLAGATGVVTKSPQTMITVDTGKQTCPLSGFTNPYSVDLNVTFSITIPPNLTATPTGAAGSYILSAPIKIDFQATAMYSIGTDPTTIPLKPSETIYSGQTTVSTFNIACNPSQAINTLSSSGSGSLPLAQSCSWGNVVPAGSLGGLQADATVIADLHDLTQGFETQIEVPAYFTFALGSASTPQISVSPNPLDFGNVDIGTTANKTLTVSNKGTGPLTVSALDSSDPVVFNVTSPSTPFTVAANSSTPVTVQYTPATDKDISGTLTIVSNDPSSPTPVMLSGTALCPGPTAPTAGGRSLPRPKDTSPCGPPTLSIDHIEVLQSTQTPADDVPWIAGKTALVRVFPKSDGADIPNVTGSLNGLPPTNGPVTATNQTIDRSNLASSLNFLWPAPAAGLSLTAQISAPGSNPPQTTQTDSKSPPQTFITPTKFPSNMVIRTMSFCLTDPNNSAGKVCPNPRDIESAGLYVANLFPFPDKGLDYLPLPIPERVLDSSLPFPAFDLRLLLNLARSYGLLNILLKPINKPIDHLAAWLPSQKRPDVGGASRVISDTYSGPSYNWYWSEDVQVAVKGNNVSFESTTTGDQSMFWYLAHRLGHQFGLTDMSNEVTDEYGFLIFGPTLIPNKEDRLMDDGGGSYPNAHWIAPSEYKMLAAPAPPPTLSAAPARDAAPSTSLAVAGPSTYAIVSGTINLDGSGASLDPVYRVSTSQPQPASNPSGNYCLVFSNSSSTLGTYCFTVDLTGVSVPGLKQTIFSVIAPWPTGTTTLTLNQGSTALATLAASQDPVVTITSPQAGAKWQGTNTISWTNTGTGSSSAVSTVLYSSDGGNTWMPMELDNTDSSFTFDTGQINGGSQVYFQVLSSTGLNTGSAMVGPINVVQTPKAGANPAAISFGNVAPGQMQDQTFSITNNGSGPLTVTNLSTDNAALSVILPKVPFTVNGGGAVSADLRLTAPAAGAFSANLIISSTDPATPTLKIPVTANSSTTPAPSISVSSSTLDFGQVVVGQGSPADLTISNTGLADLTVLAISSTDPEFKALGLTLPVTISASSFQDVQLQFMPTSTGAKNATLTVTTNDPSHGSSTLSMTGTGVPPPANAPQITAGGVVNAADYVTKVSRGSLAFAFGNNLASPPTAVAQSIPLPFSANGASVTVAGFPAPVYVVDPSFIEFQVPYEAPLGSVPVVVSFNGTPSNTVNVTVADYAVGPFQYNRTATIVDPDIFHLNGTLVTPTSPAVPSETLIVIANGIGKLNNPPKTNAAVSAPYPTAVDTPVVTVGGVAAVSQYAGLLAGDLGVVQMNIQLPANLPSGTLPVVIQFPNDSSPPVGLYVMGNIASGAPQISVAPLTFSGGTVGQSQTLPLVITNAGSAPLTISSISLNPSGGPFTINYPSLPFTLQPGGSTGSLILASVTVTFTPTSPGTASAVVTIASNDPNTPVKTVGLSGTAAGTNVPPSIAVTPSGLNFSSVAQGSSKQVSVTVSNAGGTPLNVSALTAGGMFSVVSPVTPFTVAPGSSSTVTLQFSPIGVGGQSSTLNIASNDSKQPNLSVPIWGTGYNLANVLTSDSFNRANATECALGTTDLKFGGTMNYQYLPIFPSSSGPVGASIVSGALQNNGVNYGGVQLTTSTDVCGAVRGSTLPQDLDGILDVSVPGAAGAITAAGLYFRSRAAAPGDGIFGGTSSGYSAEVFSTGQVWVDQLNPYATIAQSAPLSYFDPSIVHTLEARIQGTSLQVWLDGQPVTFTLTSGGTGTTVPVSTAANAGTAGIIFTSEQNAGKAGGQSAKNLIISSLTATATAPQISVSPTSLNLGSLTVGQSANVSLNISNIGTAALNVTAIASSSAAVTIVSPSVPFTLQPGATTPVTVKFAPTAAGAVNGMLTINSSDPAHGQTTVSFSGTGVAAAGTPVIGASVTSVAFGNVAVGQVSTISFNVLNTGTAALTVSSVAISNPVFGLMTPAIPLTAQPGSITPVTVVFAPQSAGPQSATFTVTSNDPAHPVVAVTLTGTGTGAPNNLLAYSNVVVGQSETGTLTFTNTGTTPLTVTAQTTTNAAFTVPSPSTPYSIPAGQSAVIVIVFNPTAYTVYNATFSLVTNGGTFTTPLSGAGVAVQ
jgi:uncharacterized protein (TIGR03437 family)